MASECIGYSCHAEGSQILEVGGSPYISMLIVAASGGVCKGGNRLELCRVH